MYTKVMYNMYEKCRHMLKNRKRKIVKKTIKTYKETKENE